MSQIKCSLTTEWHRSRKDVIFLLVKYNGNITSQKNEIVIQLKRLFAIIHNKAWLFAKQRNCVACWGWLTLANTGRNSDISRSNLISTRIYIFCIGISNWRVKVTDLQIEIIWKLKNIELGESFPLLAKLLSSVAVMISVFIKERLWHFKAILAKWTLVWKNWRRSALSLFPTAISMITVSVCLMWFSDAVWCHREGSPGLRWARYSVQVFQS